MTIGLDTSVVLRLLVGEPVKQFEAARARLGSAHAAGEMVVVTDLVVAEAWHALHHHYGVPKDEARRALRGLVTSRLVELMPASSLPALDDAPGAALVDRLIHWRHLSEGARSLTFDALFGRFEGATVIEPVD